MTERFNPCKALNCSRCCRDIPMDLTNEEATSLVLKGARLSGPRRGSVMVLDESRYLGTYDLKGVCPNLINGECSVVGTSDRPSVCDQFQYDGRDCRELRRGR